MALLVACGGGGGDTAPPAATTFPVQAALTYAYTHGLQSTLNVTGTASYGGYTYPVTGWLTITVGAATSTTFNGAAALQTSETIHGTLTIAGQSAPLSSFATSYLDLSHAPLAFSTTGSYCVAASPVAYPANASAGQSGDLGSFVCYADSARTSVTGTESETYSTRPGSRANTLDVTLVTRLYDPSNMLTVAGSATYTITSEGIPSLTEFVMTTTTQNGITVNLTASQV